MKVVLKIGHERFLLKSDKGLKTILDALSEAENVYYHSEYSGSVVIDDVEGRPSISATYLPLKTKFTLKSTEDQEKLRSKPLALPAPKLALCDREDA